MTERWRTELRRIDRLAPDHDVVERAIARPPRPDPGPSRGTKIATIIVALALPIAGISAAYVAFRGDGSPTLTTGTSGSPSTENGDLLYTKNVNNGWSLFVLDPDTGVERQITEGFRDYGSDWSPDGRSIVYDSELSPGGQEGQGIWVANADGSNPRQLIENGSVPAWSPDGTRIAFARPDFDQEMVSLTEGMRVTSSHLFVMDADGTNVQRLTDGPVSDFSPAWSPNGAQIAFLRHGRDVGGVFVMSADGTDARQLGDQLEILSAPDWAPDGSSIAVAVNGTKDGPPGGIMLLPADGSSRGRIIPGTEVEYRDHVSNPAWSPDGEWIAYVHGYPSEIVIMHPDGSARRTEDVDPGNDSIEELAWGQASSSISSEPEATFEYEVPSESMRPSFRAGQVVKVDPEERTPERGDVIVFADPNAPSAEFEAGSCPPEACYLKRVIGLPGETIEIRNGTVLVNDDPLSEPYAFLDSSTFGPVTLEPDTYFVMGDNRSESSDSRTVLGAIPEEAIAGTVVQKPS